MAIEVDGFQHELDNETVTYDEKRTKSLSEMGIVVFRVKNTEINNNFLAVCNKIDKLIKSRIC